MRIDPADLDPRSAYRLMISVVVPRPIAWVSTCAPDGGLNAAPFSYFQALSSAPPMVMIAVGNRRGGSPKDTRRNIEATGEFVVNIVSEASGERMVATSADFDHGVSEFEKAGLTPVASERVTPPRIAECAVAMECKLDRILEVGSSGVLIGEVVLFHVVDEVLAADGTVDPWLLRPLGRLGRAHYAPLREVLALGASEGVRTERSELLDFWAWTRDRSAAMARALTPEQLGRRGREGGMCAGRMLRHLAGCTNCLRLVWEGRGEEDEMKEWDSSWDGERIARELEQDRDLFSAAARARLPGEAERLRRLTRHEAWHQGQVAALVGGEELWRQ